MQASCRGETMNGVLDFMGQDHDRLDKIFADFKRRHTDLFIAKLLFHDFKTGLQRHIVWEEEILFPLFEDKMNMHDTGPTVVMRMEHLQIKEFLEKIHGKIAKGEVNGIKELENELLEVLKVHNDKEESILYPWIDEALNEQEREEVFKKMNSLSADKYDNCCGSKC